MLNPEETRAWDIHEIEALTESEAQEIAIESMEIKGHQIYFVDFGRYFGYSCLVFADGHHIYYANDYQLHHAGDDRETLREKYIEKMNNILFTDDEFTAPLHSYSEYSRKMDYLRNKYPQRRDHISIWFYGSDEERAEKQKKITSMIYCPFAFAYFLPEDRDFVSRMTDLHTALIAQRTAAETDPEYLKSAILYEMHNHEYGINWQGNWDVLSCFGNIKYNENDNPGPYFDQLGWSDEKRDAFWKARAQYWEEQRRLEEEEETA